MDGPGSEGGECEKDASGEDGWWQRVSGAWRVVNGGSGRVSGQGDRWQVTNDRQQPHRKAWAVA